jgi:hypothetical protein
LGFAFAIFPSFLLAMSADPNTPDYDYVAYIDESGDQGLQKVKPLDPDGSSERLVVSRLAIRKKSTRTR